MLDTARRVETPEGVELDLHIAGPLPRALAWTLDSLIRFGMYIALNVALAPLGRFGFGAFLILVFLVEWFYPVLFEVLFAGSTPGKRALGLRVLHDDGTPVGWSASVTRNLLRFVDFLPLFYAFGLVSCLLNRDFKRLGDLAAGTIVVYSHGVELDYGRPQVPPRVPPVPLNAEEQRILMAFAERHKMLTGERARELALAAGPLVGRADEPDRALLAMANWIAGER